MDGFRPVELLDLVPASVGDLAQVRHFGRNTLPAFTLFEKRFCRPKGADPRKPDSLYGFNFQALSPLTGPGYFVARPVPGRPEVDIDYRELPPEHPDELARDQEQRARARPLRLRLHGRHAAPRLGARDDRLGGARRQAARLLVRARARGPDRRVRSARVGTWVLALAVGLGAACDRLYGPAVYNSLRTKVVLELDWDHRESQRFLLEGEELTNVGDVDAVPRTLTISKPDGDVIARFSADELRQLAGTPNLDKVGIVIEAGGARVMSKAEMHALHQERAQE